MCISFSVMSDSFVIPWTVAHEAPLSMEFPRQEYWSGLPFPSPGDLPNPGVQPASLALAGGFVTSETPRKPQRYKQQRYTTFRQCDKTPISISPLK